MSRLFIVRAMDKGLRILDHAIRESLLDAKVVADHMASNPKPNCYCIEVEDFAQQKIVHMIGLLKKDEFAVVGT